LALYADHALQAQSGLVCGANEADTHYTDLSLERDVPGLVFTDLRRGQAGDPCHSCGKPVQATRGIEVGHIFKLGTKYSEALYCQFTDDKGQRKPMIMGCYGFGVTRMVGAIIEQCHDDKGLSWPLALAPYKVVISVLTMNDPACVQAAEKIYEELREKGAEPLLDDRDVGAGFKFKDADLVGIPLRIAVGAKSLKEGKIEFSLRSGGSPEKVSPDEAVSKILNLLK
jgi:prolyl-tRNA synthetase